MKLSYLVLILLSFAGCVEKVHYPINKVLRTQLDTVLLQHQYFYTIGERDLKPDTIILSKEEVKNFFDEFLREFPPLAGIKGTVENQDRKESGKRKFITYHKKISEEVSTEAGVTFTINDEGQEILWMISYHVVNKNDTPNPTLRLYVDFLSGTATISKGRTSYKNIQWR